MPQDNHSGSISVRVDRALTRVGKAALMIARNHELTIAQQKTLWGCFEVLNDKEDRSSKTKRTDKTVRLLRFLKAVNKSMDFAATVLCASALGKTRIQSLTEDATMEFLDKIEIRSKSSPPSDALRHIAQELKFYEDRLNAIPGVSSCPPEFWLKTIIDGDQGPIEATFRPLTVEVVEILKEQVAISKEAPKLIVLKDKYEPHISLNIDIARQMMS
ncbi:MAG: hypothetical protein Q9167_008093 [Letrouitia subvulpina]